MPALKMPRPSSRSSLRWTSVRIWKGWSFSSALIRASYSCRAAARSRSISPARCSFCSPIE
jgi:hypothetical protein